MLAASAPSLCPRRAPPSWPPGTPPPSASRDKELLLVRNGKHGIVGADSLWHDLHMYLRNWGQFTAERLQRFIELYDADKLPQLHDAYRTLKHCHELYHSPHAQQHQAELADIIGRLHAEGLVKVDGPLPYPFTRYVRWDGREVW